ncbi:MAG TPA: glycosyltransferase family 2 protein [Candidatus Saccharimonadales bacterium]|nr:glycosyltransferase family 2 protein [Candidatus Saccharimonadales bacterium]
MIDKKPMVSVIIPCYNEEASIANVLRDFQKSSLAKKAFDFDLMVIDNNSTDRTAEIADQAGARVIKETRKGKGNAMRTAFNNIDPRAEYVVMIDGDDTYRPEEVLRLLEPLHSGFCDVVVGSRLGGKIHGDSMRLLNRGGNWLYTHLVRVVYGLNVTDVLSGYFAWKRHVIDELAPHLRSHGFAIEMEMITKMSKMKLGVYSVPISYHQRGGHSSLRPFSDGAKILQTFSKNLRWSPHRTEGLQEET